MMVAWIGKGHSSIRAVLIDLPPVLANFPAYVASGYDPASQAAKNILAAEYPPDIVNRAVTPVDSLWGRWNGSFWEVPACQAEAV